ncbi:MAG TPA: multicopper oxidase domain-containing protein [Xanthomonadaceae bacterium]|nr:multicopper oxidase domain-containing protein [Xanthomonadaceae bacterium]
MNRRRFLSLAALSPLAALSNRSAFAMRLPGQHGGANSVVRRASGGLSSLTAAPGNYDLGDGPRPGAMLFNGSWPAPTIRLQQGDLFDLILHNNLDEPTIVHWHGLLPPADMDGHPIYAIGPGESRPYLFSVHERASTYWYHTHPHHRTAYQAYHGLAGFLIVDDGLDEVRGLPPASRDIPLLLADKRLNTEGAMEYNPSMADIMRGLLGNTVLVNGRQALQMSVEPAVHRLRLLNGSTARILNPAFADGRTFWLIGTDAGLLDAPLAVNSVLLSPGERVELLVDFRDDAGTTLEFLSALANITSPGPPIEFPQGAEMPMMRFVVDEPLEGESGEIPELFDAMPPPAITEGPVRPFVFTQNGPDHFINGLTYELERIDFTVEQGEPEIWRCTNAGNQPHPMHMHGAHFRVLGRSGEPIASDAGWKDTVLVRVGETVDVALRFDVPGLFLFHCHNLEHEDHGMMLNFVVNANNAIFRDGFESVP